MNSHKFSAILIGAILTNLLSYYGEISPVVAAASVALVFAALVMLRQLKTASQYLPLLYMGTFVGMSNLKSLSLPLALISLVAASAGALILAQLLAKRLIGVGGKLGLIAFAAGIPLLLLQGLFVPGQAAQVQTESFAFMMAIAGVVLILSLFLRKTVASPVGISAVISLLGALTPYPAVIMAASFAGMSADQNLSGWRLATVALVFAGVFSLAFGLVEGVGGWLGLLACASVYLVVLSERVIATIRGSFLEVEEAA